MEEGYYQPAGGRRHSCDTCNRFSQAVLRKKRKMAEMFLTEEQKELIEKSAKLEVYATIGAPAEYLEKAIMSYQEGNDEKA